MQTLDDMWVFAYGSLLWQPGFEVAEQLPATLPGYARSFCMRSIHHRGTADAPGLVLALDKAPGARCSGLAMRVAPGHEAQALADLRERELISSAYYETRLRLETDRAGTLDAITYVIDPDHVQYCGGLPLETQARIISTAIGGRGPNFEYLFKTVKLLSELGVNDDDLTWLDTRVRHLLDETRRHEAR